MDPNATLRLISDLLDNPRENGDEIKQAASDLASWIAKGGFQPRWDDHPDAWALFVRHYPGFGVTLFPPAPAPSPAAEPVALAWTACPACSCPFQSERCDNPDCEASGNVPPAILARRRREAEEEREREHDRRIRSAMNSMPESYWGD